MKDISEEEVRSTMGHGTISRLGLIVKEKPEVTKRRVIMDLRRPGGNWKATLPERLALPRPRDAVAAVRDVFERRDIAEAKVRSQERWLGVASEELPSLTRKANTVCFCTLLFGYKTAPLLWSAMMARIQQSPLEGHEGQHLVCCGYYRGTCAHGTPSWPWVLTTASALGFKVSLKKGERSRQVSWIGIRMTLRDALILGLPAKYTGELVTVLKRWEGAGMASLKELRQVCGKVAWLAGILPMWQCSKRYCIQGWPT
jgi:hypothetical protein